MSITRFRLPNTCHAPSDPEGEIVLYADHAKALANVRLITEKQAEQARAWKALAGERGAEIERLTKRIPDPDDLLDVTGYVLRYCPDEMTREMASRLRATLEVQDER